MTNLSQGQALQRRIRLQYTCSKFRGLSRWLGQELKECKHILTLAKGESIVAGLAAAALATDDVGSADTLPSQGAACRAGGTCAVAVTWQGSIVVESHQGPH